MSDDRQGRLSRAQIHEADRRLAAAPADRLRRPLPVPPLRRRDADRGDDGGAERRGRAGKARYIGFSEWTAEQIRAALAMRGRRSSSPRSRSTRCSGAARRRGLPVLSRGTGYRRSSGRPLAQGVLTGKYRPGSRRRPTRAPRATRWAAPMQRWLARACWRRWSGCGRSRSKPGCRWPQLALAWVLREHEVASAIVGASRPEQVRRQRRRSRPEDRPGAFAAAERLAAEAMRRRASRAREVPARPPGARSPMDEALRSTLAFSGVLLFLIGPLGGAAIPVLKSPRIALSAHVTALQAGVALVAIALLGGHLALAPARAAWIAHALWISFYVLWAGLFLGGVWGTGRTLPLAGAGQRAEPCAAHCAGADRRRLARLQRSGRDRAARLVELACCLAPQSGARRRARLDWPDAAVSRGRGSRPSSGSRELRQVRKEAAVPTLSVPGEALLSLLPSRENEPCPTRSWRASGARRASTSWSARSTSRDAEQRDRERPRGPRVPVHGRARRRQDHRRAHPRQGAQLRARARRRRRATSARTAGRSPPGAGRRAWRSTAPPTPASTTCARSSRTCATSPRQEPLQDLHHRRGPHALEQRLQRAAEDARGAAAARQVHLRHDRSAQAARHHAVALPALRLPPHPAAPDGRARCARSSTAEAIEDQRRALFALAREGEGSMRDAQSLLDQVIACAGSRGRRRRRSHRCST